MRKPFLFLLALLMLCPAGLAWAGNCQCTTMPLEQVVRKSALAFAGIASGSDFVLPEGGAAFEGSQIYKGTRQAPPIVDNNPPDDKGDCAVTFYLGQEYFVIAQGNNDSGYYTDKCMMDLMNTKNAERNRLLVLFSSSFYRKERFLAEMKGLDVRDIRALRKLGDFLLKEHRSEEALGYFRQSLRTSRGSVIDSEGMGEAYLQMGLSRAALRRFDDALEKDNSRRPAWLGRYRALAQLGRWSEIPKSDRDLSRLELMDRPIAVDLAGAKLAKSWFVYVDVAAVDFSEVDFSEANLTNTRFNGTNLQRAKFYAAFLYNVDLSTAKLEGADFTGIRYENVKWPEGFTPPTNNLITGVDPAEIQQLLFK